MTNDPPGGNFPTEAELRRMERRRPTHFVGGASSATDGDQKLAVRIWLARRLAAWDVLAEPERIDPYEDFWEGPDEDDPFGPAWS